MKRLVMLLAAPFAWRERAAVPEVATPRSISSMT